MSEYLGFSTFLYSHCMNLCSRITCIDANWVPDLFREQAGKKKIGLRHSGLLCKLSSLQCCREQCNQAKKQSLPQSTYNPENTILNSSIWCNKAQFAPVMFWFWRSSSLLVHWQKMIWGRGRCLLTTRKKKKTLQPPLHSMPVINGMYSLLSHNGSNMPRALLNRKKMQAQVIRGNSIVQCGIISSRAEKLRVLNFSCTRSYWVWIN